MNESEKAAIRNGLHLDLASHMEKIEHVLGPKYKLTLLAKYHGPPLLKDADMMLTNDTRENMIAVIDRFYPPIEVTASTPAVERD